MIIEFYGLPGSGKSTIARKLAEGNTFRIIKIRKKSELIFYNLKYALTNPLNFCGLLLLVIRNSGSGKEFYHKFMNCFLDYNAKFEKAKKFQFAILDQGYFQNIISLFNHELSKDELKKYCYIILQPDKLFIFSIASEERQKRQAKRGYGERGNFTDSENKKYLAMSEYNFNNFLKYAKQIVPESVILDSTKSMEEIIAQIKSNL